MVCAVEQAGVLNSVNYMLRFLPAFLKIRDLCHDGTLGRLLSLTVVRMRGFGLYEGGARHWAVTDPEESGGWIVHHACHGIDLIYWLAGEFQDVYAQTQTTLPGSPELVWGMGRLKSGATAVIADSVCGTREQYVAIVGTRGQLFLRGQEGDALTLVHEPKDGAPGDVEHMTLAAPKYPFFFKDSVAYFFDCLRHSRLSEATIRQARYSLAVAAVMVESDRTGTVVAVSPN